jgi:predicted transcriptional regulator
MSLLKKQEIRHALIGRALTYDEIIESIQSEARRGGILKQLSEMIDDGEIIRDHGRYSLTSSIENSQS